MKKSQLVNIVKEVIKETIRKIDGKYVVYPEKGGKRLGTHDTRAAAEKQLRAIHVNKEDVSHRVKDYQQKPPVDWEKRDWELYEDISYSKPNFEFEWEEARRYPEFEKIGKEKWIKVAKKGKPISYGSVKDYLGNVDLNFDRLEDVKKERFKVAFEKGTIEMPIVVKFSNKDYDLIAGNTRLSGLIKNKVDPKLWVVDISTLTENIDPKPLPKADLNRALKGVKDWHIRDSKLSKRYNFETFEDAIKFIDRISKIFTKENHHPIIRNSHSQVDLQFYSGFANDKITSLDFKLAKLVDREYENTLEEDIHKPMNPGILKKRLGKLSCTKVRKARAKLEDKGTTYAKALQRYLNYHCQ